MYFCILFSFSSLSFLSFPLIRISSSPTPYHLFLVFPPFPVFSFSLFFCCPYVIFFVLLYPPFPTLLPLCCLSLSSTLYPLFPMYDVPHLTQFFSLSSLSVTLWLHQNVENRNIHSYHFVWLAIIHASI